jgi:RNA polymerase sigma factor (sigma-70 family)
MADSRSDDNLVAGIRAADDDAFDALYDRYHRNLLAFCHHMLGSREEAEDVLQHTFLAAYRSLRSGDDRVQVKAWLYAVARNRCLSVLRARRHTAPLDEDLVATEGLAAEVDRRADLRALVRDVQRLPHDQRAALLLFELGDSSHDDIAAVLGIRRQKVKALVFQARETLMSWRAARDTPCAQVREQLATLTGSALRRGSIRRHVEQCQGCAEYQAEVHSQRAALAIALPVVPAAGLKAVVLGSVLGGSGVAVGAGVGAAGLGAKGIAAKLLVVTAVAGGAGATGYVAVEELEGHREAPPAAERATPAVRATPAALSAGAPAVPAMPGVAAAASSPAAKTKAKAKAKAKGAQGRALGTKVASGKAAAPGQLKSPGSPAQGKALGAKKAKVRPAKGESGAKRSLGGRKAKPQKAVKAKPQKAVKAKRRPAKRTASGGAVKRKAAASAPAATAGGARKDGGQAKP